MLRVLSSTRLRQSFAIFLARRFPDRRPLSDRSRLQNNVLVRFTAAYRQLGAVMCTAWHRFRYVYGILADFATAYPKLRLYQNVSYLGCHSFRAHQIVSKPFRQESTMPWARQAPSHSNHGLVRAVWIYHIACERTLLLSGPFHLNRRSLVRQ